MIEIRFGDSHRGDTSKAYGPFEYAELTYTALRVDDGREFAVFTEEGKWLGPIGEPGQDEEYWSDVVISTVEGG